MNSQRVAEDGVTCEEVETVVVVALPVEEHPYQPVEHPYQPEEHPLRPVEIEVEAWTMVIDDVLS